MTDISSIYETDPVGYTDQDLFLNMAAAVKTSLSPFELLDLTQRIEKNSAANATSDGGREL